MIRWATLADLPRIEEALIKLKGRSEFRTVVIEFERGRKTVRKCISSPQGFAAISERNGKISGVLIGTADSYWYSSTRFASDFAFTFRTRAEARELLRLFKAWADGKNAQLLMGQTTGTHGKLIAALYAEVGLVPVGTLFVGERPIAVRIARSA